MTSTRSFAIAPITSITLVALVITGCATENAPVKKAPAPMPATVLLTGANGDMSKYLGTWTSECGREFRVTPEGRGIQGSGTNSFTFSTFSGTTVEGTLAIDTFETPDCSGPSKRSSAKITMSYIGSIAVRNSYGENTAFTGTADKLAATIAGGAGEGNTFNIGFLDGFSKFQLAPLDNFSATNLVYSRKS